MKKVLIILSIILLLSVKANAFWNTTDYLNTYNFYSKPENTLNTLEIFFE
mgnify:CR=1 FL=1